MKKPNPSNMLKELRLENTHLISKVNTFFSQNEQLRRENEELKKEIKQLSQHRVELTRAMQAHGRIYSSLGDALRHLGLSLEHSEPAKLITPRHMED
jgi:cell shape-determining protein MreC